MNKILIKNIGELLTGRNGSLEILHNKEILIREGKIESVGKRGEFSEEGCEVIDAGNSLVTPGLGDPHPKPPSESFPTPQR